MKHLALATAVLTACGPAVLGRLPALEDGPEPTATAPLRYAHDCGDPRIDRIAGAPGGVELHVIRLHGPRTAPTRIVAGEAPHVLAIASSNAPVEVADPFGELRGIVALAGTDVRTDTDAPTTVDDRICASPDCPADRLRYEVARAVGLSTTAYLECAHATAIRLYRPAPVRWLSEFSPDGVRVDEPSTAVGEGLGGAAFASALLTRGRWYWEVDILAGAPPRLGIGIAPASAHFGGHGAYAVLYAAAGLALHDGDERLVGGYGAGDRIGVAVDLDAERVFFSKNARWVVGDPAVPASGLPLGSLRGRIELMPVALLGAGARVRGRFAEPIEPAPPGYATPGDR